MGYVIMIMAWSSGSLWIAGSDKISGYCERSEKRVTVNGVNSNEKFKNCMKSSRVRLTSLSYSVIIMENKKWILEEFNSILWEEYRL